jgi:predicted HicB family RNase H-like nuclease
MPKKNSPDFEGEGSPDNVEAAMHDEASRLSLTVPPSTVPGSPASRQVLLRATPEDHDRWKAAAEHLGVSMAEFIRGCCNEKARDLLDCGHPLNMRRYYPWAEFCLKCGQRLRG